MTEKKNVSSPVEHELVCPKGHHVSLVDGHLICEEHGFYALAQLVRSGRTRSRQFTIYPKPEPFQ
jgi:hypothetical protein